MTPEDVAARRAALETEDDGWAGTIIVEPLTALAGGILGGALVSLVAWRLAWRTGSSRAALAVSRRVLR